jgi:hypothetical protein
MAEDAASGFLKTAVHALERHTDGTTQRLRAMQFLQLCLERRRGPYRGFGTAPLRAGEKTEPPAGTAKP